MNNNKNNYAEFQEKAKFDELEPTDDELDQIGSGRCSFDELDDAEVIDDELEENYDEDLIKIYLNQLKEHRLCSPAEETELFLKIKNGNETAKQEIINKNLRLVISIAKKYVGKGVDFSDLIQEGNMGLMKAVERFDVYKGYKFSTYATWWIRQAITRCIADKGRTIRLPVHLVENVNKYKRTIISLEQKNGKKPTIKEIAKEMDIPIQKAYEIERNVNNIVSLDLEVGEEDRTSLSEFIKSDDIPLDELVMKGEKATIIKNVIATLTPREQAVILNRFGFNEDNLPRTLEEIGTYLGITRERVRQIESKALKKLKIRLGNAGIRKK